MGVLSQQWQIYRYRLSYAYSVILVALLHEYGWSRSVLAGAFSVFTLMHGAANPVFGALCDRIHPLRLMAAGGAALGLAPGIVSSGVGVGGSPAWSARHRACGIGGQ